MKEKGRYGVSGPIEAQFEPDYFAAIQAGMDRNYKPMERLFAEIIENSIQALSGQYENNERRPPQFAGLPNQRWRPFRLPWNWRRW